VKIPFWDYESMSWNSRCFWHSHALSFHFCKAIHSFAVHQARVDALPLLFLSNTFCIFLPFLFTISLPIGSPFSSAELAFLDNSVIAFHSKVF
jgi:hypothetical protein